MKSLATLLIASLLVATVNCSKSSSTDADSTDPGGGGGGGGTTPCSGKLMFVTAVSNGILGGASGADTTCNANIPGSYVGANSFKAYLGDVGARAYCYTGADSNCSSTTAGRVDWPLAASTTYCNVATTTVGTTDANGHMSATGYVDAAHAYKYFTGFNIADGISNSDNCTDYSTTAGASSTAGLTNGGFGASTFLSCASAGYILCVEQ